jgi:hypothetical protein
MTAKFRWRCAGGSGLAVEQIPLRDDRRPQTDFKWEQRVRSIRHGDTARTPRIIPLSKLMDIGVVLVRIARVIVGGVDVMMMNKPKLLEQGMRGHRRP